MKTVSISVDDAAWEAALQEAEKRHTTVDALVSGFLEKVAVEKEMNHVEARRAKARHELADALAESGAVVGEKPTRERTYSDRRFHRH